MRGGKLVSQPTDLSEVIDIRDPAAVGADAQMQCHELQPVLNWGCSTTAEGRCICCPSSSPDIQPALVETRQPEGQQCRQRQRSSITALTFSRHPGLTVFPSVLCPVQQLQLMHAALEQWPHEPVRTNHTKQHGLLPQGLFNAAQAGLALVQQTATQQQQVQQQSVEHSVAHIATQQPASQACSTTPAEQGHQDRRLTTNSCNAVAEQLSTVGSLLEVGACQHHTAAVWAADAKGIKASVLLRKLRWASLGPPFNWTDRVYDRDVQYLPLPQQLKQIACHHAALAASINSRGTQSAVAEGAQQVAADQPTNPQSAFAPDVALVNYYHAGDTLGGHKDDVEPDMTQPIVTMSLGCEAVFLMGGSSREETPTALLLRSGDVVVLAGQSRSCYHGVPRIFTDKSLPSELLAAAEQHQQYQPHVEYFKQCRVNISVRCIV